MSEMPREPPTSEPSSLARKPQPANGSLAAGVGQAWLIMIVGEVVLPLCMSMTNNLGAILGSTLLPPLAILVWGLVLLNGDKPRRGKGMLLGLLSIAAVLLLLVAACFGLVSDYRYHG